MGLKLALAAVVILCCALAGRAVAAGSLRRSRALRQIMDGLQLLRIHMLDRSLPLPLALGQVQEPLMQAMAGAVEGKTCAAAWQETQARLCKKGAALDCLTGGDCLVMQNFFSTLGRGGREEQKRLFETALRELGRLEEEATLQGQRQNRLYTSLGALAGAAVAVGFL